MSEPAHPPEAPDAFLPGPAVAPSAPTGPSGQADAPKPPRASHGLSGRVPPRTARRTPGGITPRQVRAIGAILVTKDYRAAAKAAEVGERTLRTWRHDPGFAALLRAALRQHRSAALQGICSGILSTGARLASIASSRPETMAETWAQIRAAEVSLQAGGILPPSGKDHGKKIRALERRVAALEEALHGPAGGPGA